MNSLYKLFKRFWNLHIDLIITYKIIDEKKTIDFSVLTFTIENNNLFLK